MKGIYLVVILYVATLDVIALNESPVADIPTKCPEINPGNETVFLPHENDCTKFYSCHMGIKGKPLECPVMDDSGNRLHFNPKLQVCDWPWRAGCQTSSSTTSSSFPTTITTPSSPITTLITSTSSSPTTPSPSSPTPTTPSPTSPTPTTPSPSPPTPTTPSPSSPSPTTPSPSSPSPTTSSPSSPTPTTPSPSSPTPTTPSPTSPTLTTPSPSPPTPTTPSPTTPSPTIPSSSFPTSTIPSTNSCVSDNRIHMLPHEECDHYYLCFNSTINPLPQKCERDLLFNPMLRVCDFPENVNCTNIPSTTDIVPSTIRSLTIWMSLNSPSTPFFPMSTKPDPFAWVCKPDGRRYKVPHETMCNYYYWCINGIQGTESVKCESNLLFNPVVGECDYPENVDCNDRNTPSRGTTVTPPTKTTTTGCPPTTTTEKPTTTTTTTPECPPTTTTEKPPTTTTTPGCPPTTTTEKPPTTTTTPGCPPTTTTEKPPTTTTTPGCPPTTTTEIPTTRDPNKPREKCPPKGSTEKARIAHPCLCNQYYECTNGEKILKTCPFGKHFDYVEEVCDWAAKVKCTRPIPTFDILTFDVSIDDYNTTCAPEGRAFQHETDCSAYYLCSNGEKNLRQCVEGLHFNITIQTCDYPQKSCDLKRSMPIINLNSCPPPNSIQKIFLSHECECTQYYECVNGNQVLRSCPNGLHFDRVRQICNDPTEVKCVSSFAPTVPKKWTPSIPDSDKCYDENNEMPHEYDCMSYYKCSNGEKILKICPRNLYFNPKLRVCDFPENVACNTGSPNIPSISIKCGTMTGIKIPHETDCNLYYVCNDDVSTLKKCSPKLVFNPILKVCDFPENYICNVTRAKNNIEKTIKTMIQNLDSSKCIGTCPEEDPEYAVLLPNEDCKKFCMCSGGTAWVQSCPDPLYFDSVKKVCKRKKDAVCGKRSFDQDDTFKIHNVADENDSMQLLSEKNTEKHGIYNNFWFKPHFYNLDPSKCIGTCPEEDPEYAVLLPNEDCKKFCMCSGGTAWVQSCPDPLYFDSVEKVCKRKKNAVCGKRSFDQDDTFTIHNVADENDSMQLLSEKNTEKHGIYNNFWFKPHFYNLDPSKCIGTCPEEDPEYAVLLPNEDCKKFCMCSGGTAWVQSCPDPLYFDSVKKVCKRKKDAVCGKRSFDQDDTFTIHNVADENDSMQLLNEKNTEKHGIYNNFWFKPHFYNLDPSKCIGTCPEEDPEYAVLLPNEDCKKFCMCSGGTAWVQSCPDPLYFDSVKKVCKRKKDAVCGKRSFDQDDTFTIHNVADENDSVQLSSEKK